MTARRFLVTPTALVLLLAAPAVSLRAQTPFVRGEVNADGQLDVSDGVAVLLHLFVDGSEPVCRAAADADGDGTIALPDAVRILHFLFLSGSPPAAPFPECGVDEASDALECGSFPPCEATDGDPVLTEWTVPWSSSRPRDPDVGTDGTVWFVGQRADYAASFDPGTAEFTRFNLGAGTGPHNLIVSDVVWFAGNTAAHIGKLDPGTGDITRFPMPDAAARDPHTLVFDSHGDIWFTVQQGNFVGRLATATGEVRLIRVPTSNARPYGIVVDQDDTPWFVEFGSYKLARINRESFTIEEFPLTRTGARPRRLGITSDGAVWYVDYAQGYLGRFDPTSRQIREWRAPGGSNSDPYAMGVDHRDRIWFVETGRSPNRLVGFQPRTEEFFSTVSIPSGGGTVRHMVFHEPTRTLWFGTDTNTLARAQVE